jgi:hypothetical protein
MIELILSRSLLADFSTEPYLDDLTAHDSESWEKVWKDTVETIRLLVEEGIMVNLAKCKFLVNWLELLGCLLFNGGY